MARVISEEEYNIVIGKMQEIDMTLHLILNEQVATQQDLEARVLSFYDLLLKMYQREGCTKEEEHLLDLIKEQFKEVFGVTSARYGK